MRLATGSVASMMEEQVSITASLGQFTGHIAIFLLGINLSDQSFLRFEVKGHCIAFIGIRAHRKDRSTRQLTCGRVTNARSMYQAAVQSHVYVLTLQIHILILHVRITIQIGLSNICNIDQ